MKRVVIFHLSYRGTENVGQRTTRKTYSIFKRKSSIVNDFFDWMREELSDARKINKEDCVISDMQIIGL